tara:strand:+ start:50 stop:316 length:267 start_codon:yes stop_codon:yes gene_type:complete
MYSVYIIINLDKKPYLTYVGYTNNLKKRLILHNSSKGAKFTKGRQWVLIFNKKFEQKTDAIKYEYKLKHDKKIRKQIKIKFLINNNIK